jgi:quercetin dioxygenase-like cupin family protein
MSRCGDVYENKVTGEYAVVLRGSEDRGDGPAVVYLTLKPGGAVVGEHVHPTIVERFTLVKGQLEAKIGGKAMTLTPGHSITAEPMVPHDWWNASTSEDAHIIIEVDAALGTPRDRGDRFEQMIGTMFGLANDGKVDPKGRPHLLQAILIGGEFSDVVVFTSPPPWVQRVMIALLSPLARALGYQAIYPRYLGPHGHVEPDPAMLNAAGP